MPRAGRLIVGAAICAALSATFAATSSASALVLCAPARTGSVVSSHWAESGPVRAAMSNRAAASIQRRLGPGVEGFHPTVADARCAVANSVAVTAAIDWAKSPRRRFSVGVRIVGAGNHPYVGRFRCTILPAGRNETGTCTHRPDRHAGQATVTFFIDRLR